MVDIVNVKVVGTGSEVRIRYLLQNSTEVMQEEICRASPTNKFAPNEEQCGVIRCLTAERGSQVEIRRRKVNLQTYLLPLA